jgi:hypothetical protein
MIVAAQSDLRQESSAVPLARYAYVTGYTECRFWGVSSADEPEDSCREILKKHERDMIGKYLAEAQDEIEQVTQYYLAPTWTANEEHRYTIPVTTRWGKVIAPGARGESDISLGAAVSHAVDPATIGPLATTVTDINEVRVFYPDTDIEISPSAITISGGNVTIEIPRCRLATQAAYASGGVIDYGNLANFQTTVDIKRVYNDTSVNATLVWIHGKSCSCALGTGCCSCNESTETACMVIRDRDIGAINVLPATYSNGAWSRGTSLCNRGAQNVRLNYYSGLQALTPQAEDAIIRLAHSKMPEPPCGCGVLQDLWRRDRNTPEVLTAERLNCPFGLNDGAWIAWRFTNAMRMVRGVTL